MIRTAFAALVLAAASSSALADLQLASLFTDHMVVQRGAACPIWGKATPGAKVELFSDDGKPLGSTVANDAGFFRLKLPVFAEGKAHAFTVKSGDDSVSVSDVLAGEVWIGSGQSNMQWSVWDSNDRENEVKSATYPNIRFFSVPRKTSDVPVEDVEAKWVICSPESVGGFSAVAYSFGRMLHKELNVPVGLIHSSWGGTIAETWTPKKQIDAMSDLPGVAALRQSLEESLDPAGRERLGKAAIEWQARRDKLMDSTSDVAKDWARVDFDDSNWAAIDQPGDWHPIDPASGFGWLRKTIDVPAEMAGKDATLSLGRIDDYDVTFVNGQQVGVMRPSDGPGWNVERQYTVPGALLKAGKNVIAVRVLDTGGAAGIAGPADAMKLTSEGSTPIALAGGWRFKLEQSIDPSADPRPNNPAEPGNPNLPSRLYNAMIHPLGDYTIRGAIWYQGESNAGRPEEYERVMTSMIGAWRDQLGSADADGFSFYQVGLANFMAPTDDPNKPSNWARLREAQRQIGKNVKRAGVTVTLDIGDEKDIHPRNKQDVGKRLALIALKDTYGKDVVSRGPTLKEVTFEGATVIVHYDNIGGGLVAKDGALGSFSIAGADGKFVWADAKIEGDTVVLSSKDVPTPTQVRYAFADNPKVSLFNKEGLPAEPFEEKHVVHQGASEETKAPASPK